MKARLAHLFHHFHWRILLKLALLLVTLVVLFYVEENWRGARALAATKAKWEAQGETFDYAKFVPPPVPDNQNLATIPLFHLESVPLTPEQKSAGISVSWKAVALEKALAEHSLEIPASITSNSHMPDSAQIGVDIAVLYNRAFGAPPSTLSALGQVDALCPFIAGLNREAAIRPSCRFNLDYAHPLADSGTRIALIAGQLPLAGRLRLHAMAAFVSGDSEAALADLRTLTKLSEGIRHDSSLLSGLVLCGMVAYETDIIAKGIAFHVWTDAQLAQISEVLAPCDLLADYQFSLRGELVGFSLPAWYELMNRSHRVIPGDDVNIWPLIPTGWFDFHEAATIDTFFDVVRLVDPAAHRVFPTRTEEEQSRLEQLPTRPWNMLLPVSAPILYSLPEKFARAQVNLDEARIALALERYRLAHGTWPDTLDQLAVYGLPHPPVDPIDGQPYRYRVQFDGTFLLYSIGWNNTDDEGQIVTRIPVADDGAAHDSHDRVENYGDWVWQPFAPEK